MGVDDAIHTACSHMPAHSFVSRDESGMGCSLLRGWPRCSVHGVAELGSEVSSTSALTRPNLHFDSRSCPTSTRLHWDGSVGIPHHGDAIARQPIETMMRVPNGSLARTKPKKEHGRHIFAYCHVTTNQVLYSLTQVLNVSQHRIALDPTIANSISGQPFPQTAPRRRCEQQSPQTPQGLMAPAMVRHPSRGRARHRSRLSCSPQIA